MSRYSISVGQYVNGHSILHRLDPRVKLISTFLMALVLFAAQTWGSIVVSTMYVMTLLVLSRVSVVAILLSLRTIALFLFVFSIFQVLAVREGTILFTIGTFSIYGAGLWEAGLVFWRTLLLFLLATVLTATTKPFQITNAIDRLLSPLKKVKVPVTDLALMMSIALRFIPILKNELFLIRRAQDARGFNTVKKTLSKRVTSFIPLLVPLFVRSLKRAEDLAQAMEARGYNSRGKRTVWKQDKWTFHDTISLSVSIGTASLIMWL